VGTKPNSGSDFSFEVRTLSRQDTLIVLRKPVYLRSSGLHGFGTVLETPTFRRAYEFQLKEVLRLLSDRREHPIPTRHIGVRIPPPQPGSPGIRPDRPISRERPAIGRLSCIRESLRVAHGPRGPPKSRKSPADIREIPFSGDNGQRLGSIATAGRGRECEAVKTRRLTGICLIRMTTRPRWTKSHAVSKAIPADACPPAVLISWPVSRSRAPR
jgi:hypothetical protein